MTTITTTTITTTTDLTRQEHIDITARVIALGFTINDPKKAARLKKTAKVGIIQQCKNMLRGCTDDEIACQFNNVIHDLLERGTPIEMIEHFINFNDDTY
jgi:hypothetical protein